MHANETAVIVIDMQVDGCSRKGSKALRNKKIDYLVQMTPVVERFIKKARDKNVKVIFSQHIEDKELVADNTKYLFQEKGFKYHSYQTKTGGTNLVISPNKDDTIIRKSSWSVFSNKRITRHLKGIKNLILLGSDAQCCVLSSIIEAYSNGYTIYVPEELVGATDANMKKYQKLVLELINKYYGFVLSQQTILKKIV